MPRWRSTALVAVTGLVSGTFGAVVYGHFTRPSGPRSAASSTEHPQARASVIPPGWDPTLVSRLANVEEKLDKLGSPVAAASLPAKAPASPGSKDGRTREERRAEHYQKELDLLERHLADHASEPRDDAWASPLTERMQRSLSAAFEGSAQTTSVDCRSKTCTATLSFPTPGAALASIQQSRNFVVLGCKGGSVIPKPPTNAGPYDLTVVYNCR